MSDFFADMQTAIDSTRDEPKPQPSAPKTTLAAPNPAPAPDQQNPVPVTPLTKPGDGVDLTDLFGVVPQRVKQAAGDVQAASDSAAATLDSAGKVIQQAGVQAAAATAKAVVAKTAINNEAEAQIQRNLEQTQPLFARKEAIAQRQDELNQMNPIRRAVLGIFDKNYNKEYLAKDDAAVTGQINTRQQEFTTLNTMRDKLMEAFSRGQELETATGTIAAANANTDIQIASSKLSAARGRLSDLTSAVGAQSETTRAQMLAAGQALDQAGPNELVAAAAQAAKNGGKGTLNGIPVSAEQIKERQMQQTQQQLGLAAAKNQAVESGMRRQITGINLQDTIDNHIISNMSRGDVQSALNNGGMFQGHKLDQVQLGARLQGIGATENQVIDSSSTTNGAINFGHMIDAYGDKLKGTLARGTSIFGSNIPPEVSQAARDSSTKISNFIDSIHDIKDPATRQRMRAQGQQMIVDSNKAFDAAVDTATDRMARNPDQKVALTAWMTGTPMTQAQANASMLSFTDKGSLPPGIAQGPALKAIQTAQAARLRVEGSPDFKAATPAQQKQMLMSAVSSAAGSSYTNDVTSSLMASIPSVARDMKHPFGSMISDSDYRTAVATGDAIGRSQFRTKYGIDDNMLKALESGASQEEIASMAKKTPAILVAARNLGELPKTQSSAFLNALDQVHPGASSSFASLISNPAVQHKLTNQAQNHANSGFAENLVSSAAGGTTQSTVLSALEGTIQQHHANGVATRVADASRYAAYGNDPYKRIGATIALTPDMTTPERAMLLGWLKQVSPKVNAPSGIGTSAAEMASPQYGIDDNLSNYGNESQFQASSRVLLSQKAQDPAIERLRKMAAKDWTQKLAGSQAVVEHLTNSSLK